MRVGHNPARFVEKVAQPAEITVTVVNCIPFLSGYYEQSLDVLKMVIDSLNATRAEAHPYDVMIFDNHSCAEVREYLKEASDQAKIQYLIFSDTNIGKIGAWNFIFGAAQGKYVVFSDGDILYRPGWLQASLELFETFPNVGMVTARPYRASENIPPPHSIGRISKMGVCSKKAYSWIGRPSGNMDAVSAFLKSRHVLIIQRDRLPVDIPWENRLHWCQPFPVYDPPGTASKGNPFPFGTTDAR